MNERPDTVVVCLASDRARERVSRACQVVGVRPTCISTTQLRTSDHGSLRSLIYDLAPWTPSAAATLVGLNETFPELRILLYVPIRADGLEMLPRFGSLPGVCTKIQSFSVTTFGLLCGLIRSVSNNDSSWACERMVTKATPNLTPRVHNIVRLAAANITGPRSRGAFSVTELARHSHLSVRTLDRKFSQACLPPPKEVLDWMVLMHVADGSSRSGTPPFQVARSVGCDANAFYRIKIRRLGRAVRRKPYSPDLVQDLFDDRCQTLSR